MVQLICVEFLRHIKATNNSLAKEVGVIFPVFFDGVWGLHVDEVLERRRNQCFFEVFGPNHFTQLIPQVIHINPMADFESLDGATVTRDLAKRGWIIFESYENEVDVLGPDDLAIDTNGLLLVDKPSHCAFKQQQLHHHATLWFNSDHTIVVVLPVRCALCHMRFGVDANTLFTRRRSFDAKPEVNFHRYVQSCVSSPNLHVPRAPLATRACGSVGSVRNVRQPV